MVKWVTGFMAALLLATVVHAEDKKIVLFDGTDESQWVTRPGGEPANWKIIDGAMETTANDIVTRDKYKDFTLHVEFWIPKFPDDVKGQARGNSGVYLQGRYEIQVLDSYALTPGVGDCGAIYSQKAPDSNACKPPEEWQTYDITFKTARFDDQGKKIANARVTVFQNGTKIQDNVEITGPTGQGDAETAEGGPIRLQYHHNTDRFRNVWIIPTEAK